MSSMKTDLILRFQQLSHTMLRFVEQNKVSTEKALSEIAQRVAQGASVFVFGNGGSMSQALHFQAELLVRFNGWRAPLPCYVPGASAPTATACSNDSWSSNIFSRELQAFQKEKDIAIGLTTSGKSRNVIEGLATAKGGGLLTVALTGENGIDYKPCDLVLRVPSADVARIQEVHLLLLHLLAEEIEAVLPERIR